MKREKVTVLFTVRPTTKPVYCCMSQYSYCLFYWKTRC